MRCEGAQLNACLVTAIALIVTLGSWRRSASTAPGGCGAEAAMGPHAVPCRDFTSLPSAVDVDKLAALRKLEGTCLHRAGNPPASPRASLSTRVIVVSPAEPAHRGNPGSPRAVRAL